MELKRQELEDRRIRFCSAMKSAFPDWDAALIVSKVNQYYFTGTMQDALLLIYRDGRRATISPAYDLVSVVAYTSLGIDTSLALRIGNRRRFDDVNLASFQRLGNKVGSGLDVGDVVRDTSRLVMSGLDQLCDDLAALPATMRNAVATHVRDMSARLR